MSENQPQQEQVMQIMEAPEEQTIQRPCAQCGTMILFKVPNFEILNSRDASMVLFAHPKMQVCQKCGTPYQFVLKGIPGIQFGFAPTQVHKQSQIVIAPPGMKVPTRLD